MTIGGSKVLDGTKFQQVAPKYFDFWRHLPYDLEQGFSVCIDAVHKLNKELPCTVVHCLNPPGGVYTDPKILQEAHFTTRRDFVSGAKSPKFLTQPCLYLPPLSAVSTSTVLIIDVRQVDLSARRGDGVRSIAVPFFALLQTYFVACPCFVISYDFM